MKRRTHVMERQSKGAIKDYLVSFGKKSTTIAKERTILNLLDFFYLFSIYECAEKDAKFFCFGL